jgi:molybdenum cofactor cytidylyltransferase
MIVGVLLAAGSATRFGGDKLLAELSAGRSVVETACANLRPAVDRLIVIIRPDTSVLAARLAAMGVEVCVCTDARHGMGASLAYGVAQVPEADGWLIGLGDMPLVPSSDAILIAAALRAGAAIAVPVVLGQRGHPVGFARRFFAELTVLTGDLGARAILARYPKDIVEVPVNDARTWRDVDTGTDLEVVRHLFNKG